MIAERSVPTGTLPERRTMTREQRLLDQQRRHFDTIDAELEVARVVRDYELRVHAVPCEFRPGVFHIEFSGLTEEMRAILQGACDGLLLYEIARSRGVEYQAMRKRVQYHATKLGSSWWGHLVPIAVYYGICVPTMFIDKGEYA